MAKKGKYRVTDLRGPDMTITYVVGEQHAREIYKAGRLANVDPEIRAKMKKKTVKAGQMCNQIPGILREALLKSGKIEEV